MAKVEDVVETAPAVVDAAINFLVNKNFYAL